MENNETNGIFTDLDERIAQEGAQFATSEAWMALINLLKDEVSALANRMEIGEELLLPHWVELRKVIRIIEAFPSDCRSILESSIETNSLRGIIDVYE